MMLDLSKDDLEMLWLILDRTGLQGPASWAKAARVAAKVKAALKRLKRVTKK